ncbi:rho guanine nucleotide exchange factor 17 [Eudromia elegans]
MPWISPLAAEAPGRPPPPPPRSLAPSVRRLSLRFAEPERARAAPAAAAAAAPAAGAEPPRWPSVPAMRRLFGESCPEGGAGGRFAPATVAPVVARVSKVNLLPFGAGGSRGGSRCSSTETLKEDEAAGACWPGRPFPTGYGIYRSPSLGPSDGVARGQPQGRARPPLPSAKADEAVASEALQDGSPSQGDRATHRKSLSNPDIATETLTLLSFLKADLSELKVKRKGVRIGLPEEAALAGNSYESGPGADGHPTAGRGRHGAQRWAPGERPTLKELTATLRRAKSFTCSEKAAAATRRPFLQSAMKQSSSELLLASAGARRGDADTLPVVVQDQYIQEARQVFESIRRMGRPQEDRDDAEEEEGGAGTGGTGDLVEPAADPMLGTVTEGLLSHEDEGIVTEPEAATGALQQPWEVPMGTELPIAASIRASLEASCSDRPSTSPTEAPATPSAARRRRKFPSVGAAGREGGGGEGGGDAYRSLSDPMPHRRHGAALEAPAGPLRGDLLASLRPHAGSAASDLSLGSEGPRGYGAVLETIVGQPGAMAGVADDKGNGKALKKKSFSDPSRRGQPPRAVTAGAGEAIREAETACIPPSSSEPILSEPRAPGTLDAALADVLSPRAPRRGSKKRGPPENRPPAAKPALRSLAPPPPPSLGDVPQRYALALNAPPAQPKGPPAEPRARTHVMVRTLAQFTIALEDMRDVGAEGADAAFGPPGAPETPPERGPAGGAGSAEDMRKHVIMTLLDTEQSYVESLRTLMQGYMKPLKQPENSLLCDPSLVDEIFDQIPELLEHHEQFLEQIHDCVQNWHEKQKVGDLLVQSFSKDVLVNIYSAYIDNFLNAKDAVRIAKEARPAFMKFLEQSMRENKEKQALSDLMIKPVQRIPRYELLVKDLLKHTPEDHPDHPFLIDAQRNIKQVAERINKGMKSAEEVERNARIVQEIESHIEGMEDLQAPLRRFLRQEMVVEVKAVGGKKDRSFFLFSDLLVCTTLKRKSGSLRRSSMSLYTAASVIDTASKYKLLWKLPLEDVDIIKGPSQATNRESVQKSICRLDEDLSTLGQVSKLSESLSFPHQSLDDVIKDLMAAIHRELAEKQSLSFSMSFPPNKVELAATKADGTESFVFEFPNPDARQGFEQAFEEAKKKLASSKNCLDPEFLKAIPIMKTRSGMQFSCASPSGGGGPESACEVWVCNSDGYVGQVCLLSMRKEPTVEACIAVCSARILCIAAVPGLQRPDRERPEAPASPVAAAVETAAQPEDAGPQQCLHISISGSSLELSEPVDSGNRELMPFDSDDTDDESSPSPSGTLQSQASHSTISSSFGNEELPSCKEAAAEATSSEEEQEPAFLALAGPFGAGGGPGESAVDGRAMRRSSRGSFTRGSLEELLSLDPEAHQSSMWLGTEDGCIHVYQSSDNIRNRKNSMKMQHAAAVMCILYLDNQVFVSLANGELIAYQREAGRFWDPQHSRALALGSPGSPVTKMVAAAGKLWCGCQNRVLVLNTATLVQEHAFAVGPDAGRAVSCMASAGPGVWVALQSSAQVRLYHATSYEQLAEADVTPPVHKMLAGADAIIRQHKAACLRVTALLACGELLWVGTSAGVVLTLPAAASRAPPALVGLPHGHTGHVRFLAALELPPALERLGPAQPGAAEAAAPRREAGRARGAGLGLAPPPLLVISGGDGYEDFRLAASSDTVGRDDSTNHLLLWRA